LTIQLSVTDVCDTSMKLIEGIFLAGEDIRVPLSAKRIRDLYDFLSYVYDFFTRYEEGARKRALAISDVREAFKVLDVGCGTGKTLIELARKVTLSGEVCGLDISSRMIEKTRKLLLSHSLWRQVNLVLGDAAHCPFRDAAFDLVFNSYMLDLVDGSMIPKVLSEFRRVLKTTGRLVLVSLTKGSKWYDNMRLYEWIYKHNPTLLGGCRPVVLEPYLQQTGFKGIEGSFIHAGHLMPTKILSASKAR
jgi:ubiquinone/menaquinone biosynthesis C-methylase UbiE